MKRLYVRVTAYSVMASLLTSCASAPGPVPAQTEQAVVTPSRSEPEMEAEASIASQPEISPPEDTTVLGSGVFVQSARSNEAPQYEEDGVTLNFEDADLREFLRVVFETILQVNYLVDPAVSGSVTLHTTRPVAAGSVLATVETVLQLLQNHLMTPRHTSIIRVPLELALRLERNLVSKLQDGRLAK